jgi:hypothetical protein
MNCKYPFYLIFCINLCFVHIVSAQLKVGNNNKTVTNNAYFEIESTTGTKIVVRKDTAMMGINNSNPKNKLEITHGINGNSGLRFTNLTNTSSAVSSNAVNQKFLSVNSSGDVVLANAIDQIISVSGLASNLVSPISAATFQAGTFENSFSKVDSTVLYLNQTDGTTWVYSASNGGEYKSYVAPSSTAWFLNNTTTDAGNNKTAGVARSGFVTIGTTSALNTGAPLNVIQPSIASLVTLGAFYSPNNNSTGSIMQLVFGQSNSTGNNAEARFIYQGNNAPTNRVDFGISGNANPMISYLNNGNVGIANTSPLYKLDVAGKGRFTDSLFGTKAQFNNLSSGASTDSIVTIDASGNLKKRNANVFENNWLKKTQNTAATSNTDTIYQMGFVGVQTSTPSFPLEVMGTNTLDGIAIGNSSLGSSFRSKISAQGSGANDRWMKFNSDWSSISNNSRAYGFFRGTNEYLTILDNGNVGIGNASPLYKLDVTGKGRFTDSLIGTKAQFNNLASGASTDSIVTIDASGNLKKRNANQFENNWLKKTQNTPSSSNTDTIYQMGNVGIGTNNPQHRLVVKGLNSQPSTMGVVSSNAIFRIEGETNHSIDMGTFNNSPYGGYVQMHNKTSTSTLPYSINPLGGNVGIGIVNPSETLTVTNTQNPADIGIYASVSLPTASDMITSQIKLGPSKDWHTTIRNVLPSGAIGSDISDLQFTTGQASNNNTQVSRLTVKAVSGNVGIGTNTPASKLEVNGSATNTTAFNAAAGTTIDFSKSNLAYTSASAGAFTLTNIKDGGTYTLAVQGATSGTSTFSASGFTFKSVNNGATTASKHTLYTFVVMGTNVYFYMATGF